MRVAVVANTSWYLHNFRSTLMSMLRAQGHDVLAVGGDEDEHAGRLRAAGQPFAAVSFNGAGTSVPRELRTVVALRRVLLDARADVVLTYTPKATIYSSLALAGTGVPMVANISGLGRAFVGGGWLPAFVRRLYQLALRRARVVFFQNPDDRRAFVDQRLVRADRTRLLPGSGVDLMHFAAAAPRSPDGTIRALMVARLLWSKGVGEYVAAARALRADDARWRFALLGAPDASPTSGVPRATLEEWIAEGVVDYLGTTDDVRPHLHQADVVVLPSYREGLPRSLLEAAACARPVITTNAPGCRECVVDGRTGLMCIARDADDLTRALREFAAFESSVRDRMGAAARAFVEERFDERIVLDAYQQVVASLDEAAGAGGR